MAVKRTAAAKVVPIYAATNRRIRISFSDLFWQALEYALDAVVWW